MYYCMYKEDVRVGKEVPDHFQVLSLKNGKAIWGILVMKAREIRIRWKNMWSIRSKYSNSCCSIIRKKILMAY